MKIISRKEAKLKHLKRYYPGTPCKRGNIAERSTTDGKCFCRDCITFRTDSSREYKKEYNKTHDMSAYHRDYYLKNKELILKRSAQYAIKYPEKVKGYTKKSIKKHKSRRTLRLKIWRQNNPEKHKAITNAWNKRNQHKNVRYASNRRLRKMQMCISFHKELTDFVFEQSSILCKEREASLKIKFQTDHMIPLQAEKMSGLHVWNNFQSLPRCMNASKQNKLIYTNPHEWLYDIPKFFKVVYQKEIAA